MVKFDIGRAMKRYTRLRYLESEMAYLNECITKLKEDEITPSSIGLGEFTREQAIQFLKEKLKEKKLKEEKLLKE